MEKYSPVPHTSPIESNFFNSLIISVNMHYPDFTPATTLQTSFL